jgi:hypothetical protein
MNVSYYLSVLLSVATKIDTYSSWSPRRRNQQDALDWGARFDNHAYYFHTPPVDY